MILFQARHSVRGIPVPSESWEIEDVSEPDEIVIPGDSFSVVYDKAIITSDVSPQIRYSRAGGFTRRQIIKMINITMERFYREEREGTRSRGIRPVPFRLYGLEEVEDEPGVYYLITAG